MKRRYFLITSVIALCSKISSTPTALAKTGSLGLKKLGKKTIYKINNGAPKTGNLNLELPANPEPFKDTISIEIIHYNRLFPIEVSSSSDKIMYSQSKYQLREKKKHDIQYMGPDLGWIVIS